MKKGCFVLIGTAILWLFAPANQLLANSGFKQAQAQYPNTYVSDYIKGCMQRATAEGLPEPEAESVCNCTIARFQAQYTIEEFEQLTKTADSNPEAAEALAEVGMTCFEAILYEDESLR